MKNRSLFEYTGTARDIFYQYKFENCRPIARWYAQLMKSIIVEDYGDYILVPSPSESRKKIHKGWDQVEEICRYINKDLTSGVISVLSKKKGAAQKQLDLEERKKNLKGRIIPNRNIGIINGKNIVLIDDVFTTGATAHECAAVLKQFGAREVVSLTVAVD